MTRCGIEGMSIGGCMRRMAADTCSYMQLYDVHFGAQSMLVNAAHNTGLMC